MSGLCQVYLIFWGGGEEVLLIGRRELTEESRRKEVETGGDKEPFLPFREQRLKSLIRCVKGGKCVNEDLKMGI